jgi:hypothetical protein
MADSIASIITIEFFFFLMNYYSRIFNHLCVAFILKLPPVKKQFGILLLFFFFKKKKKKKKKKEKAS